MAVERDMWRRCRRIVDSLPIPAPFDPARFVDALARRRGRPVELVPMPGGMKQCGALVATDRADYLFYAASTTRLHQEHILLHEVGHLLCGHTDDRTLTALPAMLLPNLSDDLVRRVLGRSDYSVAQEQEAELIASMIAQRARRGPAAGTGPVDPEVADGLARLGSIFDTG
ncbi:hypothetical protein KOI35_22745 [Actinoplanes bogorensis]|uniref:IrrE N-terminal-like domain-containing protein n=1 Tax=Paractinoplanes bogorensis TaxID=1610840 RepID=A0ABS5YS94_9ACTN|nr:hypothetical protein [Actinoplanes bogorensis]MBU2666325.1 hypothetical protein [Actinoplanes bogorensis]